MKFILTNAIEKKAKYLGFNKGVIEYFNSQEGKSRTKNINSMLEEIISENDAKYLV